MRQFWKIFLNRLGRSLNRTSRQGRKCRTLLCLEVLEDRTVPALIVDKPKMLVDSAATLTAAINDVNTNTAKGHAGDIEFDPKLAGKTITLTAILPAITKPVYINTKGLAVTINGNKLLGNGLDFEPGADDSRVFGITVQKFQAADGILLHNVTGIHIGGTGINQSVTLINNANGIHIQGKMASANYVVHCFIGTNSKSEKGLGNAIDGIYIDGGASNNIGGLQTDERNIISGNGADVGNGNGIEINNQAKSNKIIGNYIGVSTDGTTSLPNRRGISVYGGSANIIGTIVDAPNGIIKAPANVISGNIADGLLIASSDTVVQGNYIGTDASGTKALGNGGSGILVQRGSNSQYGGPQKGAGNVISSNAKDGVKVEGPLTSSNNFEENYIGVGKDGKTNLPNGGWGINFDVASGKNKVKGGNKIKKNTSGEVNDPGMNNKIADPNSIDEPGPGIDNGTSFGTPVITSATVSGLTTLVQGTLSSTANTQFTLEFFGNNVYDPNGGPGQVYLGDATVTTDSNGNASFSTTLNAVYGPYISATATDTSDNGGTSEFAQDVTVTLSNQSAVGGTVWDDLNVNGIYDQGEAGVANATVTLTPAGGGGSSTTTTDANGNYLFSGLTNGSYYLQITPPAGYSFTAAYQGDDINDSHADPSSGPNYGQTETFTLDPGQYNPFLNIGLIPTADQPSTTTTLAADESPSSYGDLVTFTATVTAANGIVPGGNVTFYDNGNSLGTADLTSEGNDTYYALFSSPSLAVGDHTITATYSGDGFYTGSSATLAQTVQTGYTFTSLATSGTPALANQPVTFTAIVDGFGDVAPTGSVTFDDGSTEIGSGTLSVVNGVDQATFTTSTLAAGSHDISALYNGDSNYQGSSDTLTQVISAEATSSISLNSSNSSSTAGQDVTFTALVSGSQGTPTGVVTFEDDGSFLGTATLDSNGQAALTTSGLSLFSSTITAIYGGDATYAGASTSIAQMVAPSASSLYLSTSNSSVQANSPVTFTATVSGTAATPTGLVTFMDGSTELDVEELAVVNGMDQASFTTSSLASGGHDIIAIYDGDYNFSGSQASLNQSIFLGTTETGLTSSLNPSQLNQPVTFTASVSSSGGTPTGDVTFLDGTTVLGTGTLAVVNNQDQATYTTSALTSGAHAITAIYEGDGTFAASTGTLSQIVEQSTTTSTTTSVSASPSLALLGQAVTFTATVTGSAPTGTVTFLDGTTVLGSGTLSDVGGQYQATYNTSSLALGDHDITAIYSGDSGNAPSSGTLGGVGEQIVLGGTTTSVSTSASPVQAGTAVTFTATVQASTGTPTGTVTFFDGSGEIGTGTLAVVNGQDVATFTTSALAFGNQTILAVYGGDSTYGISSGTTSQGVVQVGSSITLSSSANPSTSGQAVTFTATVTGADGGTPTGDVQFFDGTQVLGTATLAVVNSQDVATFSTSALVLGTHAITAIYLGDGTYSSSGTSLTQVVNQGGMNAPLLLASSTTPTTSTVSSHPSTNPGLGAAFGFHGLDVASLHPAWNALLDSDPEWLASLSGSLARSHRDLSSLDAFFGMIGTNGE